MQGDTSRPKDSEANEIVPPKSSVPEPTEEVSGGISPELPAAFTRLQKIAQATSQKAGREYFDQLTETLAQVLKTRMAFVSEALDSSYTRLRFLSLWEDGHHCPEQEEYLTKSTPCGEVYREGQVFIPSSLKELFPRDEWLQTRDMESYFGMVLRNAEGNVVGHLVVLDDAPMATPPMAESLLRIFTDRAGAELERMHTQEALGARERELKETNWQFETAHRKLKESQRLLLRHERLRAMGQMASGIAHDFNNNLMVIVGFADLLMSHLDRLEGLEKEKHWIRRIHEQAEEAAATTQRLTAFYSTKDALTAAEDIDLNAAINAAIKEVEPTRKELSRKNGQKLHFLTELQPVPLIRGEEDEIHHLLSNLILNALDAVGEGGTITIRTSLDPIPPAPFESEGAIVSQALPSAIPFSPDEYQSVVLHIKDSGVGMSEAVCQHCFSPFFSTKGLASPGLGLAVVHGIVQRHRGAIDVQSQPGKGTTFTVRFPARIHVPAAGAQPQPGAVQESSPVLKVLVVDDEAYIREIISSFLELEHHEVTTANDGKQGLEAFRSAEFDLMITDMAMPNMSGSELATAIRSEGGRIPIILVTGFGEGGESAEKTHSCFDAVLRKPILSADLLAAVKKVWHRNREAPSRFRESH